MIPGLRAERPATSENAMFPRSFRTLMGNYFLDRSAATANLALAADYLLYPEYVRSNALAKFLARSAYDSMQHLCVPRVACDPRMFADEIRRLRQLAIRFQ